MHAFIKNIYIFYISCNLNLVNLILRENSKNNTMNIISLWWNSSMFVISMVSNTSGNHSKWKTDARMSLLNQGRNEIRFNNSDGKCLLENWVEEVGTYNFHTVSCAELPEGLASYLLFAILRFDLYCYSDKSQIMIK